MFVLFGVLCGSSASADSLSLSSLRATVEHGSIIVTGSLDYGTFAELRNKAWLIDPGLSFAHGSIPFGTTDFHEHESTVRLGDANLLRSNSITVTLVDSSRHYDSLRLAGAGLGPTVQLQVHGYQGPIGRPAPAEPGDQNRNRRGEDARRAEQERRIEAERQRLEQAALEQRREQSQLEAQQRRWEKERQSQQQFHAIQQQAAAQRAEKNRMKQLGSNPNTPLGQVCGQLPEKERLSCVKALEPRVGGSQEGMACLAFDTHGLRASCASGAVPDAKWNTVETIRACQDVLGTSKPGLTCVKRATARDVPVPDFIRACGDTFKDLPLREQCVRAAVRVPWSFAATAKICSEVLPLASEDCMLKAARQTKALDAAVIRSCASGFDEVDGGLGCIARSASVHLSRPAVEGCMQTFDNDGDRERCIDTVSSTHTAENFETCGAEDKPGRILKCLAR